MDKTIVLTEAVKAPVKKKGNRWLVTVATPGQGRAGSTLKNSFGNRDPVLSMRGLSPL